MKVKLDENLPESLVKVLTDLGHDVETVRHEGLGGSSDQTLWEAVLREEHYLITQDLDFSDVRRFAPGSHPGLLVLRLKAPGRLALIRRVKAIFTREPVEDWRGGFAVATDRKVRVRRAPGEPDQAR